MPKKFKSHSIKSYFKTKLQVLIENKKRTDAEKRDLNELNDTYKTLRYWIPMDGTIENYALNYANPPVRRYRLLFIFRQNDPLIKDHISSVTSSIK